ncbi:MAG: hypothetical protein ACKVU1_18395 [bacterium]
MTPAMWNIIAAILTLAILSYLYKDNPVYKFAEHLFVGVGAGYWLSVEFQNTLKPNLFGKLAAGEWLLVIPLVLGLLLFTRFIEKIAWLSRWSMGLMVGTFSGLAVIGYLQSELMTQIEANILSVNTGSAVTNINNSLLIAGLIVSLIYFFFSAEHRGAVGRAARVGIWFLMISFGASYGFTVMSRISLLIARIQFLMQDLPASLGLIR